MPISSLFDQYSIYIFGLLISSLGGVAFVELILFNLSTPEENEGLNHGGKIIGFFERIIVTVLVFVGGYNAIAFVLTAKSIARFERLKERKFAEYYLIGTFSSIAFAICTGLVTIYVF